MEEFKRIGKITGKPLKSSEELRKELSAPLPKEAVKPHPTKTYLSSIKAIYVTERLNSVFGIGEWSLGTEVIEKGEKGMVVIKATLEVADYGIYYESFGGNDNGGETSKGFDLGDAYKGATTDAITKICSYMEIGIEVFKGLVTAPQSGANNDLPWLNEKDVENWTNTVNALRGGRTIGDIKQQFKLSKEVEAKIIAQSQQPVPPQTVDNNLSLALQEIGTKVGTIKTLVALESYWNDDVSAEMKNNTIVKNLINKRKIELTPKA